MSGADINVSLNSVQNYCGVLAIDQLSNIKFHHFPSFFCLNLDYSYEQGTHWIALRVSKKGVEIFDSLGFDHLSFGRYPKPLLDFLSIYGKNKTVLTTPKLQNSSSSLCGFFVLYFIIMRQNFTFKSTLSIFSSNLYLNEKLIISELHKIL